VIAWWGAFTRQGAPEALGQPFWPAPTSGQRVSLPPAAKSQTITAVTFAAQHLCPFWDAHHPPSDKHANPVRPPNQQEGQAVKAELGAGLPRWEAGVAALPAGRPGTGRARRLVAARQPRSAPGRPRRRAAASEVHVFCPLPPHMRWPGAQADRGVSWRLG